jgi:hypothetical protein
MFFFIQTPFTIPVQADSLEEAQLTIVKKLGVAVADQVVLFGGVGFTHEEAVNMGMTVA